MKKLFFLLLCTGAILSACNNSGKKVEAKAAEKIQAKTTQASVAYNNIAPGSHVTWGATHLGGIQPRFGKVLVKRAEISTNGNKLANAVVEMDMASFTVENFEDEKSKNKLTNHLKSNDFFKIASSILLLLLS